MAQGEVTGLIGGENAIRNLRTLSARMASREAMLAAHIPILEKYEEDLFQQFGGKYVETGALKDSLTISEATGAIRRNTGTTLEFGTSVWYAKFQRKIDGPSGKPRGRKRVGPNLVLTLTPVERRGLARSVFAFLMGR